jgi:ribosomal protein S18 acetylase RimI-like enzyme
MNLKVVRGTESDVSAVAPLFDQYRQFYKQESDLQGARSFLLERLSKNESVIFMAIDAEKGAVGFVQLYPSFSSESMKRLWILNDLFVSPPARNHGVAERLMREAEEFARKTGAKGLELETAVDNFPAQRLYERCGYKRNVEFHRYLLYF